MKGKLKLKEMNKGFSLIELIIAIAIMAVLIGVAIYQAGIIGRGRIDSCVKETVSNLESCRLEAMSFREAQFKISMTSDGIEGSRGVRKGEDFLEETTSLGNRNLDMYVSLTKGTLTEERQMKVGDYIVFSFDRSSGAFKPVFGQVGGAIIIDNTYCEQIRFESTEYERFITFVTLTGKIDTK